MIQTFPRRPVEILKHVPRLSIESSNVSSEENPQIGICDRRGSLPKPRAADTAREEPFRRSWAFRIGCSGGGSKTKSASPAGNGKSAFLRKFRFRKGKKKGDHQEPGRRRMSDAAVAEAVHRVKLSQWTSVPQAKRSHESVFVLRAHPLPRSLDAHHGGSDSRDDGDGKNQCDLGLHLAKQHPKPPRRSRLMVGHNRPISAWWQPHRMTPLVNVIGVLALHIQRTASSIQRQLLQSSLLVLLLEVTRAVVLNSRQGVWEHRVGEGLRPTGLVVARALGARQPIEVAVHVMP
ncbi:hypothetical protein HPB50_011981 [Hyalomma asiaticum]|uniref:Uncharacterized protein n=1 Tax=Hyalomma asiaticum TaxID=266040 RepID=A0ACB7TIL6_HYAAI|nr:hypothetical protein HPB50_011981 [Hyalomma asiaticum]